MTDNTNNNDRAAQLRRKAEANAASQPTPVDEIDKKSLLHELQVHQVELEMLNEELEMQNEQLRQLQLIQEETHKSLMDSIPDATVFVDQERRIISINNAFTETFGYTLDELRGKTTSVFYESKEEYIRQGLIRYNLSKEQSTKPYEVTYRRKDGSFFPGETVGAKVFTSTGEVIGFFGLMRDISERKQAKKKLEDLIVQLQEKTAEQEQFIYTASHDLKSPLVTITGFCKEIEEGLASGDLEQCKDSLDVISNAAQRMGNLLSELLHISRVGFKINPSEIVSLETLITKTIENVSGVIAENNTTIEIEPELPDVRVDRLYFLQVLENLLANASRYSRSATDGSHVKIGVTRNEEELICYVKDNGIGIESQYLDKVFGLFERLDASSDTTGVGLAIVKRIIEAHGERIWAESEGLGHGTTFFFTLPEA